MNPRVRFVKAEKNYLLRIWFQNGEIKVFDLKPYLEKGLFSELKNEEIYYSVKPFLGSIIWSNKLDLCPDTLYEESIRISQISSPGR